MSQKIYIARHTDRAWMCQQVPKRKKLKNGQKKMRSRNGERLEREIIRVHRLLKTCSFVNLTDIVFCIG